MANGWHMEHLFETLRVLSDPEAISRMKVETAWVLCKRKQDLGDPDLAVEGEICSCAAVMGLAFVFQRLLRHTKLLRGWPTGTVRMLNKDPEIVQGEIRRLRRAEELDRLCSTKRTGWAQRSRIRSQFRLVCVQQVVMWLALEGWLLSPSFLEFTRDRFRGVYQSKVVEDIIQRLRALQRRGAADFHSTWRVFAEILSRNVVGTVHRWERLSWFHVDTGDARLGGAESECLRNVKEKELPDETYRPSMKEQSMDLRGIMGENRTPSWYSTTALGEAAVYLDPQVQEEVERRDLWEEIGADMYWPVLFRARKLMVRRIGNREHATRYREEALAGPAVEPAVGADEGGSAPVEAGEPAVAAAAAPAAAAGPAAAAPGPSVLASTAAPAVAADPAVAASSSNPEPLLPPDQYSTGAWQGPQQNWAFLLGDTESCGLSWPAQTIESPGRSKWFVPKAEAGTDFSVMVITDPWLDYEAMSYEWLAPREQCAQWQSVGAQGGRSLGENAKIVASATCLALPLLVVFAWNAFYDLTYTTCKSIAVKLGVQLRGSPTLFQVLEALVAFILCLQRDDPQLYCILAERVRKGTSDFDMLLEKEDRVEEMEEMIPEEDRAAFRATCREAARSRESRIFAEMRTSGISERRGGMRSSGGQRRGQVAARHPRSGEGPVESLHRPARTGGRR
jgi:hypothetical protein